MIKKPDIPKIVFVGIPILLMLWGAVFMAFLFISRDLVISKYGSIVFFIISIPIYGFLAIKFASKLKATIDVDEEAMEDPKATKGFRRHVKSSDLWFVGIFFIIIPLYKLIGEYIFDLDKERLESYIKWILLFLICLGFLLRMKFGKKQNKIRRPTIE